MSFDLPYKFQISTDTVVIQHSHNGHIRTSPNNMDYVDGGGAADQWKIYLCDGPYIRLQSCKTGKYLRLWRGGKEIDVNGGNGPFTKFKYHIHSRPNGIKLESDRFPGRYIAVNPNRTMKIGSGGHHCNLWIKREAARQQYVPQVNVIHEAPYTFKHNNTVIIRSNYGKILRVSPKNTYYCDNNGGNDKYSLWRIMLEGNGVIKLQNIHTNRYLRIEKNNAVNCGGRGGIISRFRYHTYRSPNGTGVKLESCRYPSKYVAIRPDGLVCSSTKSVMHSQLTFLKQEEHQILDEQKVMLEQQPNDSLEQIGKNNNYNLLLEKYNHAVMDNVALKQQNETHKRNYKQLIEENAKLIEKNRESSETSASLQQMNSDQANKYNLLLHKCKQATNEVVSLKQHILDYERDCNEQNSDLNDVCNKLKMELEDVKNKYNKWVEQNSDYTTWDSDTITDWIINMDKQFIRYEKILRKKLKEEEITGNDLIHLDKNDLDRFGIKVFKHKQYIMEEMQKLIARQQNNNMQNDNDIIDYNEGKKETQWKHCI